jgi:hypothetical protein
VFDYANGWKTGGVLSSCVVCVAHVSSPVNVRVFGSPKTVDNDEKVKCGACAR